MKALFLTLFLVITFLNITKGSLQREPRSYKDVKCPKSSKISPFQFLAFAAVTISTVINIINNLNVNNDNNLNNNNNNINDLDSDNMVMNTGRKKRSIIEYCQTDLLSPRCIHAYVKVSTKETYLILWTLGGGKNSSSLL